MIELGQTKTRLFGLIMVYKLLSISDVNVCIFSTSACLEVFSLDLASPGLDMPLLGAVSPLTGRTYMYKCTLSPSCYWTIIKSVLMRVCNLHQTCASTFDITTMVVIHNVHCNTVKFIISISPTTPNPLSLSFSSPSSLMHTCSHQHKHSLTYQS